jgi:hypothetical protein
LHAVLASVSSASCFGVGSSAASCAIATAYCVGSRTGLHRTQSRGPPRFGLNLAAVLSRSERRSRQFASLGPLVYSLDLEVSA